MNELQNVLPIELEDAFNNLEFKKNGDLRIHGINFTTKGCELHFSINVDYGEKHETQNWKMTTQNCINLKIDFHNIGEYFYFYDKHFLLEEFEDDKTELYTKTPAENPQKLLTEIYTLHKITFGDLIPPEKFLNGENLYQLSKSKNGLFARGPKTFLDYYFKILKNNNANPYYFGNWKNRCSIETKEKFKVALLGGNYFIGSAFIFEKI